MPPLDVPIGMIDFLHESVDLFLLLTEGDLASEDACLALLLLLLVGGLLVPSVVVVLWWRCHEESPLWHLVGVEVSPGGTAARVVLEQVED
jgi:hypothetical protein